MNKIIIYDFFANLFLTKHRTHTEKVRKTKVIFSYIISCIIAIVLTSFFYQDYKSYIVAASLLPITYFIYWFMRRRKRKPVKVFKIFLRYVKRQFGVKFFWWIPVPLKFFRSIARTILAITFSFLALEFYEFMASLGYIKIYLYQSSFKDFKEYFPIYFFLFVPFQQIFLFIIPALLLKRVLRNWLIFLYVSINFSLFHTYASGWTALLAFVTLALPATYLVVYKKDLVAAGLLHWVAGPYALYYCFV